MIPADSSPLEFMIPARRNPREFMHTCAQRSMRVHAYLCTEVHERWCPTFAHRLHGTWTTPVPRHGGWVRAVVSLASDGVRANQRITVGTVQPADCPEHVAVRARVDHEGACLVCWLEVRHWTNSNWHEIKMF